MHPAIERSRVPKLKPESKGERISHAASSEQKASMATIEARIKEFPDAGFSVHNGELWCANCKCIVAAKLSSTKQHLATKKHADAAEARARREQADNFIIEDIGKFSKEHPNVVGSTVPLEEQHFRYRITESFLAAGIELSKADRLRPLLQRANFSSTHSWHLRSFVPLIEKHEVGRVRDELSGQLISVAFDGTRRVGEAINITARFCSSDFELVTRLICFVTAAKSYDASDLVQLITMVLLQHFMIPPAMVIGFSRDAVACNGLAMQSLSTLFGSSEDLPCICHTLSHVGKKFEFELLDEFMKPWYTLVCNQPSAKELWKTMIGEHVMGFSNVRWYCRAEIMMQIAKHYDAVPSFLEQLAAREIGGATTNKMLAIYRRSGAELRISLAAMLDMRILVSTTYKLEGDRLEILLAHTYVEALRSLGRRLGEPGTLVNVDAVLRKDMKIEVGVKFVKDFPEHGGLFEGKVIGISTATSTVHLPSKTVRVFKVRYVADDTEEELEDEEIRPLLKIDRLQARKDAIASLKLGFEYFDN